MKQIWNEEELAQYWSLIYEELELLKTKPQKHHLIFCMQLKSLHLVQICLVYVNTLMIQQIVSAEEWKHVLTQEDYRALSPLIYAHVNPYGVFELNLSFISSSKPP